MKPSSAYFSGDPPTVGISEVLGIFTDRPSERFIGLFSLTPFIKRFTLPQNRVSELSFFGPHM